MGKATYAEVVDREDKAVKKTKDGRENWESPAHRRPLEERKVPHPRHLLEWVLAAQA